MSSQPTPVDKCLWPDCKEATICARCKKRLCHPEQHGTGKVNGHFVRDGIVVCMECNSKESGRHG